MIRSASILFVLLALACLPTAASACSVTCQSGYYACCGLSDCTCHKAADEEPTGCYSGGVGASSCSNLTTPPIDEPLDKFLATLTPEALNRDQQAALAGLLKALDKPQRTQAPRR